MRRASEVRCPSGATHAPRAIGGSLVLAYLAQSFALRSRFASREALWAAALAQDPSNVSAYEALWSLRPSRRSAALLDRCLAAAPAASWCLDERASWALARRDLADAETFARRALSASPQDASAKVLLASALCRQRPEAEESLAAARGAVTVRPTDATAQGALALCLDARNDLAGVQRAVAVALARGRYQYHPLENELDD